MAEPTAAERNRRAREWLHVQASDVDFTATFERALQQLDTERDADAEALIAVGEFTAIRRMLPATHSAHRLLDLLGKYFAASGDDAAARRIWPRVLEAFAHVGAKLDAPALRALANAAEALGDRDLASAAAQLARTRPEVETVAADPVSAFVYDTLGYVPDATKGRLRLRIRVPHSWTALSVQNLRMSDARLRLTYTREGGRRRFELEQYAGAIPITLVCEMVLDVPLLGATVDGKTADLNVATAGTEVVVPVQIVLDAARQVELVG